MGGLKFTVIYRNAVKLAAAGVRWKPGFGVEITNPTMPTPVSRKDTPASISDWSAPHVTSIFDSTVYGFGYRAFIGLILGARVRVRG